MAPCVGSRAPGFTVKALVGDETKDVSLSDFAGKWRVLYFYTKDNTPICESETRAFREEQPEFEKLGVEVLAASVDSIESHRAWRDESLGALPFTWIADDSKALARSYGVLHEDTGLALRGTFVVNPDGLLKHISINDLPVGRHLGELFRVLQALQSGKPTQCNWQPGEPTL
jgi:alkyl hydroperoxide reductase subunit AhpC